MVVGRTVNAVAPAVLPSRACPPPLVAALAVVLLEAIALAAGGVVLVVDAVAGRAQQPLTAWGMAAFAWLFAALLVAAGRALGQLRRWGRAPLVTGQLLQGIIGVSLLAGAPLFGALLLGAALVALAGLFAPRSVAATSSPGSPFA